MKRTQRPMHLAVVLLSMLLSIGCGSRPVRIERVPTPVLVEVMRCPVRLGEMPSLPQRDTDAVCQLAYGDRGKDAACYSPAEAHRLSALLDTLIDLHQDVSALQSMTPVVNPTEGVVP